MVCRREYLCLEIQQTFRSDRIKGNGYDARRRGNAVISVNVLKNGKRLARRVCRLRVAEAPVVVASLGVSGEESEHIAEVGFTVIGKRSALLTNKIVLQTPGQSWQNLYLLDVDKINSSNGNQLGWLKGKTIPPYNNNDRNIVSCLLCEKGLPSFPGDLFFESGLLFLL